jgi:hypothetical protein
MAMSALPIDARDPVETHGEMMAVDLVALTVESGDVHG